MDSRKIVFRETKVIAIGVAAGVLMMEIVFALLGRFDRSVMLGGLVGGLLAILNFFFMAVNVNQAADRVADQDVKAGKSLVHTSYATRMVVIFIVLFACVKSGLCDVFASVIPLLFVRPVISIAEFIRK